MAKSWEVLSMLIPDGGYVQIGDTFEGITFLECEPITKKQYTDGFNVYDTWKAQRDLARANAKVALLDRMGLTAEEATLLLG
jgi:hypothetical protein